jgi:hypothetical protein
MNRPTTAILALAALLVACTRGPQPEPPEPPQAPYRAGALPFGRWGAGPIRAGTFFETPRIRDLFPGADVREGMIRIAQDETMALITVSKDGRPILEIDDGVRNAPGTDDPLIGQVRGLGGPVRGPGGERPGMTWKEAGFDFSQCEIGSGRDANRVVCARPGDGWVTYVFEAPGWESEEMPPPSVLRAKARLAQIVWTPPPAGRR